MQFTTKRTVDDLSELCLAKGNGSGRDSGQRALWLTRTPKTAMRSLWGSHLVDRRVLRRTVGMAPHCAIPSIDRPVTAAIDLEPSRASEGSGHWEACRCSPQSFRYRSRCGAKSCWSNTKLPLESPGEMALVREPGCGSNFRKRVVGFAQTLGGPLEA